MMNYSECFNEAKKFITKQEFRIKSPSACRTAYQNGWMCDYDWFVGGKRVLSKDYCLNVASKYKTINELRQNDESVYGILLKNNWICETNLSYDRKKYSYDECFEIAKGCKNRTEFQKKCKGAYNISYKNEWINDYHWLDDTIKWTEERCYNEALKYKTKSEFCDGCHSAYVKSLNNNWIENYNWFVDGRLIWTEKCCYDEALKYKSRNEFKIGCPGAYHSSHKNKWINDYYWLKTPKIYSDKNKHSNSYVVYTYIDKINMVSYVGLTNNPKRRHKEHTNIKSKSCVNKYFKRINKEIPQPIILEQNLTCEEAQRSEHIWKIKYESDGWYMLNKGHTGENIGSLGGYFKWTETLCYNEALKYKNRSSFKKHSGGAYESSKVNGWLETYEWFTSYNTFEHCKMIALKCKTRKEFRENYESEYNTCISKHWMDKFDWLERKYHKPYSFNECLEEAKKYKTKSKLYKENQSAYNCANKNKWLNELFKMTQTNIKFKGYYDICSFSINIEDDVDLTEYEYIKFSNDKSAISIFNFYKNEMMQGEKITSLNLGHSFIKLTGFYENKKPSWKKFKEEWNNIIIYHYEIKDNYLIIEPLNIQSNNDIIKNNKVLSV